jgi:hypothetical protein
MSNWILTHGLQYAGYALEVLLFVVLARRGKLRPLAGLCLYVSALFLADGVARPAVLNYFGQESTQYYYFYWLTDVVLAMGAFLLTCAFFRRACAREEKLWRFMRMVLVFAFLIVLGISALYLTRNYTQLIAVIIEFSQNLYFTCLVLITMLYVMIQQLAIEDEELALLVCGMGVQFAGEAAGLAFYHLTTGDNFSGVLLTLLGPVCTLGMLSTWIYAVNKIPSEVPVRPPRGSPAALAEAISD